jgi:thiamine phosphate synthase YjbQ (UPF0047 family)
MNVSNTCYIPYLSILTLLFLILTAKSLMNRFEHSHIDSAGIHTRQKGKAHLSEHMDENCQVLITIEGQQAKNGKWKGISYMKKNREGQILFVAYQSITTQDTKI